MNMLIMTEYIGYAPWACCVRGDLHIDVDFIATHTIAGAMSKKIKTLRNGQ